MIFTIEMRDDDGLLLGTIQALPNPNASSLPTTVVGKAQCRILLESFRNVPWNSMIVVVDYPSMGNHVILNHLTSEDIEHGPFTPVRCA